MYGTCIKWDINLGEYLKPDAMLQYLELGNTLKFLSDMALVDILQLIGTVSKGTAVMYDAE